MQFEAYYQLGYGAAKGACDAMPQLITGSTDASLSSGTRDVGRALSGGVPAGGPDAV
jgi:hypothetical protein